MAGRDIKWREVKHHWEIYLFVLPALFLIGLFIYYPAASGVFHSFFRWNGSDISEFVGLSNYLNLCRSSEFWASFKVALILGGWNVLKMIPALLVAFVLGACAGSFLGVVIHRLPRGLSIVTPPSRCGASRKSSARVVQCMCSFRCWSYSG